MSSESILKQQQVQPRSGTNYLHSGVEPLPGWFALELQRRSRYLETGSARICTSVSSRSWQPPGVQDRMVVLHWKSDHHSGSSVWISAHLFAHRSGSASRESFSLGNPRFVHDPFRRNEHFRSQLSFRRSDEPWWSWLG